MKKLRRTVANSGAGRTALIVATLLLPGPAQAFPGQPVPAVQLTVEKFVCTVTQTAPPAGSGGLIVLIKVPSESRLKSVLLKTTSGELALDVTPTTSLVGEYETIIDSEKTNCAVSGAPFLDLEREFETDTIACPEIPLFKPNACD